MEKDLDNKTVTLSPNNSLNRIIMESPAPQREKSNIELKVVPGVFNSPTLVNSYQLKNLP